MYITKLLKEMVAKKLVEVRAVHDIRNYTIPVMADMHDDIMTQEVSKLYTLVFLRSQPGNIWQMYKTLADDFYACRN